jgi:hypothetical protein
MKRVLLPPPFIALAIPVFFLLSCSALPGLGTVGDSEAVPTTAPDETARILPASGKVRSGPSPDGAVLGGDFLVEEDVAGNLVLAVVDGREIKASDLFRAFFLENPVRTRNALQNEILYDLTRSESQSLGVTVSSEKVEDVLARTIADHRVRCADFLDEKVDLEKFIEIQYGMPYSEYCGTLRRTAVFNLLLDRCVRYAEIGRERIQVGVIVVGEGKSAGEIREKLARGANFEVLAAKHSLDRSAANSGILTPIPRDGRHPLHPLLEKTGGKNPGDVTCVEEVLFLEKKMYRIVKVLKIIEPVRGSYSAVAAAVEESLEEYPIDLASIQYWQACLGEKHRIDIRFLQRQRREDR